MTQPPLIVGDPADPHVQAVCTALAARDVRPVIVDLESVTSAGMTISEDRAVLYVDGDRIELDQSRIGWLRRIHRAPWGLGITTGSVQALELGTWHSAFTWILETAKVTWITSPQHLRRAEGKLDQWRVANLLGIDYPRTLVSSSAEAVRAEFQSDVIVKPLGSGQFLDGGEVRTVYAEPMSPADPRLDNLAKAPFIVQEHVHAGRHLRVVTVGEQVWISALLVSDTDPADWRRTPENHTAFEVVSGAAPGVAHGAAAVAKQLALGYSSQDWVETRDGRTVLLDVNPSGQWLFLPERIGREVAEALAGKIMETS